MKRLKILDPDEFAALYSIPSFSEDERVEHFSLSPTERAALGQLHSLKSRVCFILQLGYFKARHQFFVFDLHEVRADAKYVQEHFYPKFKLSNLDITKVTRLKQQRLVLELFHYRNCGTKERRKLETKARQTAGVSSKPVYVFRTLMNYLEDHRIVAPGYTSMQDIVSRALTHEQNRLTAITDKKLKQSDRRALKQLLEDSQGLYDLTLLKREPRDFRLQEIKREIQRGQQIRPLYCVARELLPEFSISGESIKYYASLVDYYSVHRLKQLNRWVTYLYLLCFIFHRYQRHHDNLINCLLHKVRRFSDEAKAAAKERVYEQRIENSRNVKKVAQVLKLFTDDEIAGETPFEEVQTIAFELLDRRKMELVADHLSKTVYPDEAAFQWEHIGGIARHFKLHLRPILQAVDFSSTLSRDSLLEALELLKSTFRKGKSLGELGQKALPSKFVSKSVRSYLYAEESGQKDLLHDRYEFLVCRLLRQNLEAGNIFCRDSVRFRSFEDDLLSDQEWKKKDQLIRNAGLMILQQSVHEHLKTLEQTLEERIAEVNRRIDSGENKHFQVIRRGSKMNWSLQYPDGSEPVNHPFFDALDPLDVGSVLHFVNQRCQFMEAFEHLLGRYRRHRSDDRVIIACLIAWATNMGLGRMGEISDIGYSRLAGASDNFIRLETLRAANDLVSNAMAKLAIFRHYDIGENLHSSSDGQKFETRIDTINARHSPKYFGLKKGVVSYTLVANHIPVNAKVIGANEHESHYVFDVLFNNTTDIEPDVHSTDTHGTNQVNFAILHLFGYQFAPRYKDIQGKIGEALYGFKHPTHYGDVIIKPVRKINTDLIVEEWENIQRIIVSLAVKTTTQNIIVGKLSAYARKNKTRRALWEYDNIIRSLYLLDYVDSPPLRQNVQRALNRGENYHKLRRAVSHANFGQLRFKTEYEQQLWGECSRLVTNCIIYYNAVILSNLLTYKERKDDIQGATLLRQISPVAWQHINLHGRYQFNNRPESIDLDAIIEKLAQLPVRENLPA